MARSPRNRCQPPANACSSSSTRAISRRAFPGWASPVERIGKSLLGRHGTFRASGPFLDSSSFAMLFEWGNEAIAGSNFVGGAGSNAG